MNPDEALMVSSATGDLRVRLGLSIVNGCATDALASDCIFQGAEVRWPAGLSSAAD